MTEFLSENIAGTRGIAVPLKCKIEDVQHCSVLPRLYNIIRFWDWIGQNSYAVATDLLRNIEPSNELVQFCSSVQPLPLGTDH